MTTAMTHKNGELYYFLLPSPDIARGRAFFSRVLGWQFSDDGADPDGSNPAGGLHPDMPHTKVWLAVDDVDAAVARVRAGGGRTEGAMESPSGWHADCLSPDGVAFSMGRMRPGFLDDWTPGPRAREGNLAYFTIPARDLAAARDFFASIFGWAYAAEHSHATYAHIEGSEPAGGIVVAVETAPSLWLRVADIDAAVDRVHAAGGTAEPPGTGGSGRSAACADDQGVRFNLWQPAGEP